MSSPLSSNSVPLPLSKRPFSICKFSPELEEPLGTDQCGSSGCTLVVRRDGNDDPVKFVLNDHDMSQVGSASLRHKTWNTVQIQIIRNKGFHCEKMFSLIRTALHSPEDQVGQGSVLQCTVSCGRLAGMHPSESLKSSS